VGALWENYLSSETSYTKITVKMLPLFLRMHDQQELIIEEENGILRGYEFKWNENRKAKFYGFAKRVSRSEPWD
jgi:hypothetical protein